MTTIFTRSALERWGQAPPPNVASVVIEFGERRVVTWDDVMAARRERQMRRLRDIWSASNWRAWRLSSCYFDQFFMGGWQVMLERNGASVWVDRDRKHLKEPLMRLFPLSLFNGDWEEWKRLFALSFERRRHDRKPVGVQHVWWDGYGIPVLGSEPCP